MFSFATIIEKMNYLILILQINKLKHLNNLSEVIQSVSGKARLQNQGKKAQGLCAYYTLLCLQHYALLT